MSVADEVDVVSLAMYVLLAFRIAPSWMVMEALPALPSVRSFLFSHIVVAP